MGTVSSRRYLALWLPRLPTDRLRRQKNGPWSALPADAPLVVADKTGGTLRLVAVDHAAARLGLLAGLALADARARVPDVAVANADRAADAHLLGGLADWCVRYTPLVARDGPDGLILDITGCAHLFGGEAALRAALETRLKGFELCGQSAIAGTPGAAHAFARFAPTVVPPGGEEAHAEDLPVAALELEQEAEQALTRAGLKTLGAVAERSRGSLAARFRGVLTTRLERILGREDAPISPRRPMLRLIAERAFAEPLVAADDISRVIAVLAGELGRLLENRGEGGRTFTASLFRIDGAVRHVSVATAAPLRDAAALARLFAERLEALAEPVEAGYGFDLVRLGVTKAETLNARQHDLVGDRAGESGVAALIDRLGARLGPRCVRRFSFADSHIPERRSHTVPACRAGKGAGADEAVPEEPPARPLSLFDPPQPIAVMAVVPEGPPLHFRWRRALHEVARAEGPERIAAEWWHGGEVPFTRDYYRVEDGTGHRFWIFREGVYGRETQKACWYLHGLFA